MFLESLKWKEKPSPWQWCQENLVMPSRVSNSRPGPLSLVGQEYLKEPLEAVKDDVVTHIFFCAGAQVAKTTFNLLAWAWSQAHSPLPALWALPSLGLARAFSRERLMPFLHANQEAIGIESIDTVNGGMTIDLGNSALSLVGTNSAGELSSRPIALAIMDEASKYEHRAKGEAHPQALIEARTASFKRRKILITSTPSVEKHPFWQGFLQTDRRVYEVPCPHCGHYQDLEWSQERVVWSRAHDGGAPSLDEVRASAHYVCKYCGGEIWDNQKAAMIAAGRWVAKNPGAGAQYRGYHLNSLYSAFRSWGDVAVEFVREARADSGPWGMQHFANSFLAQPFTPRHVRVRESDVAKLRDPSYARGEIPAVDVAYLTVCYDVHAEHQDWVVVAVVRGGDLYVVDWGHLLAIEDITEHARGLEYGGMRVRIGFVDSGYSPQSVYAACAASDGQLWPMRGADNKIGEVAIRSLDGWPGLEVYAYSDYAVKCQLYAERIARGRGGVLRLPRDADGDILSGLSGQEMISTERGYAWKKIEGDHLGDCVKLALVSWWLLRREYGVEDSEVKTGSNNDGRTSQGVE